MRPHVRPHAGADGHRALLLAGHRRRPLFDLVLTSPVGTTRHYVDPAAMQHDVVDARVWNGIHFRSADNAGLAIGVDVANWAADHDFGPAR